MSALSDIGGHREFFGPVEREDDEPVFHHDWEGRVFGMSAFVQGLFGGNIDAARYAMEQLPPEIYHQSYYRRWLGGFERQLEGAGYLGAGEVDARLEGRSAQPGRRGVSRLRTAITSRVVRSGLRPRFPQWVCAHVLPRFIGTRRPALRPPRFGIGERIRVRAHQSPGHTRQPGYVTGRPGTVTAHHGAALLPDAHAEGRRARPQHLYTVAFDGSELWGKDAETGTEVLVDLYEPYLEQA